MKKATLISFVLITTLLSCQQNAQERARLDSIKIDSLQRATITRDSITLDSIKKETFNRSGRKEERMDDENKQRLNRTFRYSAY